MTIDILQLCQLDSNLERELQARYRVHRIDQPHDSAAPARCRAVVTGGQHGLPAPYSTSLPALEIVAIFGVGYEKVDLTLARERGYRVTNTPDVLTDDVADLAIGLTLSVLRQLVQADQFLRAGSWAGGRHALGRKLTGKRVGILGLGRIGQAIGRRLEAFTPQIGYVNRSEKTSPYTRFADLAALASWCDVLIVAASAGGGTLIDAAVLKALGPDGVLINVSRGALVDEAALVAALDGGVIAGAGLDVFAREPDVPAALVARPNVVLTPHIGSGTVETRQAMGELVLANLAAHFAGQPLPTPVV